MDKQAYFKMMGLDKQAAIDPQVLKNILLGTGAGLGTYALSSFLPGARQNRLARLLASLGVGLGTGYFGTDIRNWFSNRSGKKQDTSDPTIEQENAQAQQLAMQQAEREQLERQQAAEASASKTPATKAATPPPASKTPATKAATPPPPASKTPATKAATPTIEQENAQAQQLAMQQAEREQLERQQAAEASATKTTEQAIKTAPAMSEAEAQAIIQRLPKPPVIPGLKTPAMMAAQTAAAGKQKYINRLQNNIAYLKNREAVQAEKDRREALGVTGRAWQDAKNLTRSTKQQLANNIKSTAANVGQKVNKVKNVADKAIDRAGGYLSGLFVNQNELKRNEARTKAQAQRASRQKRIKDMQTEYRNLTKQQHYAEQLSTAMQKQAYFKLMGYSEPAQSK